MQRNEMTEDTRTTATTDLLDRFTERLSVLAGQVYSAATVDDAAKIIKDLASDAETDAVILAAELDAAIPALTAVVEKGGISTRVITEPEEARDAPLGLSLARLAVAETGSVLLIEPTLADRAIGLMSRRQVVVCPLARLVASLDDASPLLREATGRGPAYATLVTGPSRTADIERQLTIGVQGPAAFHVLFLDRI
jgi:L-lactate dehydrogenase complex protein LldG